MFFRKSKEQSDYLMIEPREKVLAKSYIAGVAKDPNSFVDSISPDDEMYLFTKNGVARKENASLSYFQLGRESLLSIENIIKSSCKSFGDIKSFLDFASGYGRVTRFLIQEIEANRVWVSDIYKSAVDFQRKYFKVNGFYSDKDPLSVTFPRKYEVIYAGSLFSHLPLNRFEAWLLKLYNVLEDDGILIFSTHGESLCPPSVQKDSSGFTFFKQSESKTLSLDEYGSTYVTRDWVIRLARRLGIFNIYFLEKGLCGYQDLYAVTKHNIPSLEHLAPMTLPSGYIDLTRIADDGDLHVKGWAIDNDSGAPVKEICIYANSEFLGKAILGLPRPDVGNHYKRPDCINSGWEFKGGGSVLETKFPLREQIDRIVIGVSIRNHHGDRTYLTSLI